MTVQSQIPNRIDILVRSVGLDVILLVIFESAFEVVVEDNSFVVADYQVPVCEGKLFDGEDEVKSAENYFYGVVVDVYGCAFELF